MISLIRDNCGFLQQGIDLLECHTPHSYAKADSQTFGSSVGAHMRHVLDHYSSLTNGLSSGVVDYDDRVRNTKVETDLSTCISVAKELKLRLGKLEVELESSVKVIVSANTGESDAGSVSSIGRELQFLASHTVHHYALIAIASRIQGIAPLDSFGVAPSTLKYLQTADC